MPRCPLCGRYWGKSGIDRDTVHPITTALPAIETGIAVLIKECLDVRFCWEVDIPCRRSFIRSIGFGRTGITRIIAGSGNEPDRRLCCSSLPFYPRRHDETVLAPG